MRVILASFFLAGCFGIVRVACSKLCCLLLWGIPVGFSSFWGKEVPGIVVAGPVVV